MNDPLGDRRWVALASDAMAFLRMLPDRFVHMVFTSPPYEACRLYDECGFKLRGQAWVDWLRPIVVEAARVSSGLVFVNMASPVDDFRYSAAVEWLVCDLTRSDGLVCGPSPFAWVKSANHEDAEGNGQPGSGGPQYQRRDWEPVYSFALPDRLPLAWSDSTAFGHPPKFTAGGPPSHRGRDGNRKGTPKRCRDDRRGGHARTTQYHPPAISNPGNVVRAAVGGGKLGHPIAHKGDAPMPLALAERFVCWYAPPDGIVLDMFCGTGTTLQAAWMHGRRFVGCDVRQSQINLCERRMASVTPSLFLEHS